MTQSFKHRLIDLEFLLEAYRAKHFLFNNTRIDFVLNDDVIKEKEKREHLDVLRKIKNLFDTLHITKDLQLNKLQTKDRDLLELLHRCLLYRKPYITKKKMNILCQAKIQDICILLLATEIQTENGKYYYGGTYDRERTDENVDEEAKEQLINGLSQFYPEKFEVEEINVGFRPTVADRRPILGRHEKHKNLYVFNGLGARGILNGCYFSKELFDFIEGKKDLLPEVNLTRFTELK